MRKSLLILILTLISAHLFAQRGNEISEAFAENKTIVLNDKPVKYSDLKKAELMYVKLLIQPKEIGSKVMDTTIVAATKIFAIQQYQRRLSSYSKDYQSYIKQLPNDKQLLYFFEDDSSFVYGGTFELVERLSKLKDSDIAQVSFSKESARVGRKKTAIVFINHKR